MVAVHVNTDLGAFHVGLENEAISLKPGTLNETNLSVNRTIRAAKPSRARAVHQGFRFLNENLSFAKFQEEGRALSGLAPRTTEVMR